MAIQRGPVPKKFDALFNETAERGLVDIHYEIFEDSSNQKEGYGQQFRPIDTQFNADLFSELELKTLETVVQKFGNMSTSEIIKASHLETAWKENECDKKEISYRYSFELINV